LVKHIYTSILLVFRLFVPLLSLFSAQFKTWNQYRRQYNFLEKKSDDTFLCHCASFGEYESIAPIIRQIEEKTTYKAVVSFVSPSGIKSLADTTVTTIIKPLDLPWKMKAFLQEINPIFILVAQNDYWYHFLDQAHKREIPVFYLNTYIDKNDYWLHPFAKSFLKPLRKVHTIFTKDQASAQDMKTHHFENVVFGGNLRWQQIEDVKNQRNTLTTISHFIQGKPTLVCGSTDIKDENLIIKIIDDFQHWKFIIVPHEINADRIKQLQIKLEKDLSVFSTYHENDPHTNILIIDQIGMLKDLYAYADIAYVGGGFDKGLHNVLEACIHNIPVIGGSNYQKFSETIDMKNQKRFFPIENSDELAQLINELYPSKNTLSQEGLDDYIQRHKGKLTFITEEILKEVK